MANFNELLQNYVDKSYGELLGIAQLSFKDFAPCLSDMFDGSEGAAKALMVIVSSCLGTDGKITALENKFLNELMGTDSDYETTLAMATVFGDAEGRELTDKLADVLPDDKKAALLSFCLCFLAVDETITRDEVAFVYKLMES